MGAGPFEVLVVEDDEDTRDVLVTVLRQHGLDASACSTGEQALALLRGHHFDAIVTDQMMPGITGLELVHRARDLDSHLRCVVLSGYPAPRDVDVAWLRKPISTDALFDTILRSP